MIKYLINMALNKTILRADIEQAVKSINLADPATDVPGSIAEIMADAIDAYVRSAVVNVSVTTTGTAAAQTGTGVGSLS